MSLKGELNGAVNYYERNRLADELLDILDAKVVSENREMICLQFMHIPGWWMNM